MLGPESKSAATLPQSKDSYDNNLEKTIAKLEAQAAASRKDLENQKILVHDTHYGVFPLARFVTPTFFRNPHSSGSFQLVDPRLLICRRHQPRRIISSRTAFNFSGPNFSAGSMP